jgi:hypothetical protein
MRLLRWVAVGSSLCLPIGVPLAAAEGHCNAAVTPAETFVAGDAPYDVWVAGTLWSTPWGYNKPENATREYPLVVIGCWNESAYFTESVRQKYPAFYLIFNHCSEDSEGATIADVIDTAITGNGFRIDTNRVYLTGFSKGGSGSYKLVRGFLSKGKLFAGIVRIAGASETELPDAAVENTSIWYHLGLLDSAERIQVARDAYAFVKNHVSNATAVESTVADTVTYQSTVYNRTTKTLTKNGVEIMKLSEYAGMGHVPGPPYADPGLFDWLFGKAICTEVATGFVPLTPCRALDTRVDSGETAAAPALVASSLRRFSLLGKCGLPSGAKAVSVNVTVVSATALGDLAVIGGHLTSTVTSSLSIPLTRARANNAIVQLSTDGLQTVSVINTAESSVHFILDINGCFMGP